MSKLLASKICELAIHEVGVEEVGGSNRGPRVDDYQRATWLEQKQWGAWCAAFVDFIVMNSMKACGIKETAKFKRPRTAGAWDLINWSHAQDGTTNTKENPGDDILPGDILIFEIHHTGFALTKPINGAVQTVEGNTDQAGSREGGGVFKKTRKTSFVKARIRFTI